MVVCTGSTSSAARIGLLGDGSRFAALLDDAESPLSCDDLFDVRLLVSHRDHELGRGCSDVLVLFPSGVNHLHAAWGAAFADEVHVAVAVVGLETLDLFVDRAEERFVLSTPAFLFRHRYSSTPGGDRETTLYLCR
jgi:hypothetical protein